MALLGKALEKLLSAPLWYVLPVVLIAGAVGITVVQHNPLAFDTSVFAPKTATADEFETIDAKQLEEEALANLGDPQTFAGGSDGAVSLADGNYTGYAACGIGNPDGWKPYYVGVSISVSGGRVDGITGVFGSSSDGSGTDLNWDAAENQEYLDWASYGRASQPGVVSQVNDQLAASGAVAAVDTVSGATYSAESIYNAYLSATRGGGSSGASSGLSAQASAEKDPESVSVEDLATEGLADGSYTGYAACGLDNDDDWKPYYVGATVEVKNGKVTSITDVFGSSTGGKGDSALQWDAAENQKYLDWAAQGKGSQVGVVSQVNSHLSSGKAITSIDVVSGATYSSHAIYEAYAAAVKSGAKAETKTPSSSKDDSSSSSSAKPSAKKPAKTKVGALADGTWVAYAPCGVGNEDEWSAYYVGVAVKVEGEKAAAILDIYGSSIGDEGQDDLLWITDENKAYLDWAVNGRTRSGKLYAGVKEQIETALGKGALPETIDAVSGATYTSDSIFEAFLKALEKSAAAAKLAPSTDEDGAESEEDGSSSDSQGSSSSAPGVTVDGGNSGSGSGSGSNTGSGSNSGSGTGDDGSSGAGSQGPTETGGDKDDESGQSGATEQDKDTVLVSGSFPDGTYTGHAFCQDGDAPNAWAPYYLFVTVEAKDGRIVSVTDIRGDTQGQVNSRYVYDSHENGTYLNRAINGFGIRTKGVKYKIQSQLDAGGDVKTIDTVSGATWSSVAIYDAFRNAVDNAKAAA